MSMALVARHSPVLGAPLFRVWLWPAEMNAEEGKLCARNIIVHGSTSHIPICFQDFEVREGGMEKHSYAPSNVIYLLNHISNFCT